MMKRRLLFALAVLSVVGCNTQSEPKTAEPIAKASSTEQTSQSDAAMDEAQAPSETISTSELGLSTGPPPPPPVDLGVDLSAFYEGDEEKRLRLAELVESQMPPKLELTQWMNSESLSMADLKGKVVVIDFWATWCGPCIQAIPHNNEIAQKYPDDVIVIGICHPEGSEKMTEMAKDKGIKYPIAIDKEGKMIDAYKVNGYPDYYLIDRAGKLRVADCKNSSVDEAIEALLAEK